MSQEERRRSLRITRKFTIEYVSSSPSEGPVQTKDISLHGLSFLDQNPPEVGAVIKISIVKGYHEKRQTEERIGISVLARVVRVEKEGKLSLVAVEFMNMPRRTGEILEINLYSEH